ncbi:MAG: HAD hydrolase-like protein [Melioribacteraceae bacterium]|nr:MAG: HAD hydrolase-like protein [Melioribacteraceae bacterium]
MKPLLIDMDGVLRIGKSPANGLKEFIEFINNSGIPSCIISNTTLSNAVQFKEFFIKNNVEVNFPVMTCADAAYNYVKEKYKTVAAYCSEPVKSMFDEFKIDGQPEAVVIGDMWKNWDFKILNEIFVKVYNGADIIAMQKNRFWQTPEEGLLLDVGPFVSAIEYATGKESVLIGKPSKIFFEIGLKQINANLENGFLMLGDDLEVDIKPAQDYGGEGILIYSGKTTQQMQKNSIINPDYETENLFDVIELLKKKLF